MIVNLGRGRGAGDELSQGEALFYSFCLFVINSAMKVPALTCCATESKKCSEDTTGGNLLIPFYFAYT
jgi:hypothetical protein